MVFLACARENPDPESTDVGYVRISLGQEDISISTKADADSDLPSLEDFEVEIYNANSIRLYRQPYSVAKNDLIRLNAGEFRLLAHHGDSLGAGFGKAYYLADKQFTVHGFMENGREYDEVSAVAKLSNVRLSVVFNENFSRFYADWWAVVRHVRYTQKQVRFSKTETRKGYMPGGELYLEIYARMDDFKDPVSGALKDTTVYFKSEPVAYEPNDAVTFNVNTVSRNGDMDVSIHVNRDVEDIVLDQTIPSDALPAADPYFSKDGNTSGTYSYSYIVGLAGTISGQTLSMDISPRTSFASVLLHTESDYLTLEDIDLVAPTAAQVAALEAAGIDYLIPDSSPIGYVNFDALIQALSAQVVVEGNDPKEVARFTVTLTDGLGKTAEAQYSVNATPIHAQFSAENVNIWGWKIVAPKMHIQCTEPIPEGTVFTLQWSQNQTTWSAGTNPASVSGYDYTFPDVTSLQAGSPVYFRCLVNQNADIMPEQGSITTETAQQIDNNGFEQYTQKTTKTKVAIVSDFTVTWWQLFSNANNKWWASNATQGIEDDQVATAYQDYKTYPPVALTTSGAYSGNSVMLATIWTGTTSSALGLVGTKHNYYGEIFLGQSNEGQQDNWSRTSEGHSFSSRPGKLSFMYKFDPNKSAAFYVNIEVLDAQGNVIGSATKNDVTTAVSSWTRCTMPISYSVTNKKAASLKLTFRSSANGSEEHRKIKVNTLSGNHDIFAGSILYLDNVELLYSE